MWKRFSIVLLILLLLLAMATTTSATDEPAGGCPDGFQLHPAMQHDQHHGHFHVGTDTDINADGFICAKHVSVDGDIHVHIDNYTPLP
jgi:hypothetical protein